MLPAYQGVFSKKTVSTAMISTGLILNLDASNSASYPGTGTVWTDLSGSGNHGTLINSPAFSSSNGGNLVLNGSNSYVNTTIVKSASMTFSSWAKSSSSTSLKLSMLFNSGNASVQMGPNLWFSGDLVCWNTGDSQGNPFGSFKITSVTRNWHNYTVVNDAVANNAKLYFDGNLVGTAAYRDNTYTPNLFIGDFGSATYTWNGNIANFQAYNRILTAAEVLQNYNALKGRFGY
jgi:hypothetical protein